jgi:hypothetical protein
MAFVVRRPGGRWEIRESYVSPNGPRARTLASFRELTSDVIDKAVRRSGGRLERDDIERAAKRAGAPAERPEADRLAEGLLRSLARGERVRPELRRLLVRDLEARHPVDDSFTEWFGASLEERAEALVQLLDLADNMPHRREGPLRFPRLSSGPR